MTAVASEQVASILDLHTIDKDQELDVSTQRYKDRMSIFHRESRALDSLRSTFHCTNDDEKFWWDACSGMLAVLLAKSGYDEELQTKFLQSYRKVIPVLGPRPLANGQALRFSALSSDSTPILFSLSYDGSEPIVRVAFEQYNPPGDPFAQGTMRRFVEEIAQLPGSKVDFELFDAIAKNLWIDPEKEANVLSHLPADPTAQRPCHSCLALDMLHDGSIIAKGYVTAIIKSLEVPNRPNPRPRDLIRSLDVRTCDPKTQKQLIGDLVRSLDSTVFRTAPILPAYKIIEDYTESCPDNSKQNVVMVGWDCIKPSQSRVKIYVYKDTTSLKNLRDVWTQGGRLQGPEITRGLDVIDELWPLIYDAPDGKPEDEELKDPSGASQAIIGFMEIRPGIARPVPKLYLRAGKFARNDLEALKKITNWFDKRGWPLGKTWVNDIQET